MALVDYSDSEGSGDEHPVAQAKPAAKSTNTNFSVDRRNPQKIRVKLTDVSPSSTTHNEEPAPKRTKLGGGASGFNAMLPPPKRTAETATTSRAPARKVFSLKTGAEPGFSRESDAELKQLFDEQDNSSDGAKAADVAIPDVPRRVGEPAPVRTNAFMFKPLSVARNPKKKKKPVSSRLDESMSSSSGPSLSAATTDQSKAADVNTPPNKKMSLFSAHSEADVEPLAPDPTPASDAAADFAPENDDDVTADYGSISHSLGLNEPSGPGAEPQSLDTIADDLNLSAAERRQLFGRHSNPSNGAHASSRPSVSNIINFNTDAEYAANEALRANGEAVQHNPVRAIAPGKHSLRQLVTAAQGQKDALEESFATGKRNKREAGSKYGW